MRGISVAVSVAVFVTVSAYPCGDKLASMNRGVRLQRVASSRKPASIVIFSGAMRSDSASALRAGLTRGGHRIELASSREELAKAIAGRDQDLIIASAADLKAVEAAVSPLSHKPMVIRLLENPSRNEWREERKRCPLVMKMPGDAIDYLAAVDGAIAHACARSGAGKLHSLRRDELFSG